VNDDSNSRVNDRSTAGDRPEILVAAAFAVGFVAAMLLRRRVLSR
jgi:hypothetical protein